MQRGTPGTDKGAFYAVDPSERRIEVEREVYGNGDEVSVPRSIHIV